MTTTLATARGLVSKDLNDDWASALTSNGAAGGTTLVDTGLKAFLNDWRNDQTYDLITSGTYINEERWCSALDNSTGTMTVLAHGGQILSAVTYELHRLFTASKKREALIAACKEGWPFIFNRIRDETKTMGNWLLNGDVEIWASSSYPDNWRVSAVTAAQNTNRIYLTRGSSSVKLSTAAGYLYQDGTVTSGNPDLLLLRGKSITFTAKGWCDTASCLRLAIYDGVTTTYSSYHAGDDVFASTPMSVTATISETATTVSFRVYHDVAAAVSYVDDMRVYGPTRDKIYIGDLGLYQHRPHKVSYSDDDSTQEEPWLICSKYEAPGDGYLYINDAPENNRLRIEGMGLLDFLASGVSSTLWTATVNIDDPHTRILSAAACRYLYTQLSMPNMTVGDREVFKEAAKIWDNKFKERVNQWPMPSATATRKFT